MKTEHSWQFYLQKNKAFIKKYPAGILTNPNLGEFMEKELLLICDPWIDKAALAEAKRIKTPVMTICDTNNYTMNIDKIIPGNNKSKFSNQKDCQAMILFC